jgi:subtilisin family serine protease
LPRSFVRFAVVLAVVVCSLRVRAESISTRCTEREVELSSQLSVARLDRCGDDQSDELLWYLDRIDQVGGALDGSFDRSGNGTGSVIYVMDTGVMAAHQEFARANRTRVIGGIDATESVDIGRSRCTSANKATAPCFDNYDELPSASHGTSVASIAAGANIGVAPGASIVSVRVMNERGLATTRTYLEGLDGIIKHAWNPATPSFKTAVVNISGWVLERLNGTSGGGRPVVSYAALEKKIRDMIGGVDANGNPDPNGKRFLFVVAANNVDGGCGAAGMIDRFPATLGTSIEGLITVGGMTASNTAWSGSCRGGVEVLAPAQFIFSATITGPQDYRNRRLRSGTSFATPIISGIAARLLGDRPDLTPQQLESWIEATPSRVVNPESTLADGKVAYIRSIAPAAPAATVMTSMTASMRAALEP